MSQCDFSISDPNPCALSPVTFTVDNPTGSYAWDFNDDGFIESFGTSVSYTFPASNINLNYTVILYENGIACNSMDVLVGGSPDATIGILPGSGILEGNLIRVCSGSPTIDLEVYNASSTYDFNDSYEINWGDGNVDTYDNTTFPNTDFITHSYNSFGYFSISLTVTNTDGCSATQFYTLYNGGNPSVGLANPGNTVGLCAPATIDFPITNTASNPTGTIYTVYINGNAVALYTQANIPSSFIYTFDETSCNQSTGTGNYQNAYDVQILATNPCGSSQATIEPIEVTNPPEVLFVSDEPTIGCQDQPFTFTDASGELGEVVQGVCTSLTPSWSITPGVPGVHWEIVSGNTFASDEIEVIFLIPGDYEVTMTVNSPSCGESSFSNTFSVFETPGATATGGLVSASGPGNSDDCFPSYGIFDNESTGDSLSYEWIINPGTGWNFIDTFSNTTEDLEVEFTEPGEYTVSLNATNFCATDTWDTLLVVAGPPTVDILPIPNLCGDATLNFDPSMVDIDANYGVLSSVVWSFPGAIPAASTATYPTGIQYTLPGTYTVTVTISNQCGSDTTTETFEIESVGTVSVSGDMQMCADADSVILSGTPTGGTWTGNGVSPSGTFFPNLANVGDNVLVYTVQDGACTLQDSLIITIDALPGVEAGPNQDACADANPFSITGGSSPGGGTWTVDNGGVITGGDTFDPAASGPGVYTLTYTIGNAAGCAGVDTKTIEIFAIPVVDAGPDQTLCENPFDVALENASPIGGTWTGTGVNPDGTFNAANAGLGTHTLFYSFTDPISGCFSMDSLVMTVIPNESAEAGPDENFCENDAPSILTSGTPVGGYWIGPGVDSTSNTFDPASVGVGTYTLSYISGSGVCQTNDSKQVNVLQIPALFLPNPQELCINETAYDLSAASPSGGVWSGPGITGSSFDPATAGIGVHLVSYTYTNPSTGCQNSESIEMEVLPLPEVLSSDTTYCNTPGLVGLPSASPIGGSWSGNGVQGNSFDPIGAGGVGNYTLTYSYTNGNGCTNNYDITVTIVDPTPVNAGNDFEVCIDGATIDLSQIASPAGGTWNANGSTGLSGSTFNPATAGSGLHTLTYTIGSGNCQVSDDINITVNPLPVVNTMEDFAVCVDESNIALTAFPPGGTWTANNGGVIIGNNFNANASGDGIFEFTYTFTDANGCANADDLYITVNPLPSISTNDTLFCNTPGTVELPFASPVGGSWSGPGVFNNTFDPQGAGGPGDYDVTYSYTDINGCANNATVTISVIPPSPINAGTNDTICIDQGPYQLIGFIPASGGTWTGLGIIDNTSGLFDPQVAGAGTHTLTYSYGVGNCYVEDTKTIFVQDLIVDAGVDEASCFTYDWFVLSGYSPLGGTWSGPGITDVTGVFDPVTAGVGNHTITYSYTDLITGCLRTDDKVITIHPMEEADFNLPSLVCRNEPVQFENLTNPAYTMNWEFGVGNDNSTEINPVYSFGVIGDFVVTLIVENEFGCLDTIAKPITVTDIPDAFFEPSASENCVGTAFTFDNQSIGEGLSYLWEFGDFMTSTDENPGEIFLPQGNFDTTYVVTLTVTNLCGSHIYQDVVQVHPIPQAYFGLAPQTDCSPLIVDFSNATIGSAETYFWDFGNGNVSEDQFPPTQTYFTDSTFSIFTVTLIAGNACGADTVTTEILVESANVNAAAEASTDAGCVPLEVDFTNYSTPGAVIEWDLGDGNTSVLTNPNHVYAEPGEYTVIQYANSDCGYDTTTLNISVYPAPEVAFTHEENICIGAPIEFVNESINTVGNFWDFGDGTTSTLNNPVHVYAEAGTYTVTLTGVSSFNQCQAVQTSTVTVLALPEAGFDPSTTYGCAPLNVSFNNTSSGALFFQWTFGDGNTSIEEAPSHVYEEAGTYEVTLLATDANGCFEDFTVFNIIVEPKPTAAFTFERAAQCGLPATIYFENQTVGAISYMWDFGEGSTSPFTNPTHTFTEAGTYEVLLIATNQFSCLDTTIRTLEIFESPGAGVEIESMNGCSPLTVNFNNTSSASNSYLWDFGDGTTSEESDPTHTYYTPGDYQVTLIASINDVCSDTIVLNDEVSVHSIPFANFETFQLEGDGTYEITNLSTDADSYFWEFSDGFTSEEVNPVHRFTNNAVHQIYLEASNEYGCVDDTLMSFTPDFIKGLFLPNAFSPEQGIGDVRSFFPKGIGLKEYHIRIFSTYGQLLWESTALDEHGQPTEFWDGSVAGRLMPQDVYVWKCNAIFLDGAVWPGVKDRNGNFKTIGSLVLLR
jgi:PKD repeat protein